MATTYRVNDVINCREEGPDGALLYDPDADRVRVVNHSALRIWQLCDGRTAAAIADALRVEYADPPADLLADVEVALADMVMRGLIVADTGASATTAPESTS